MKSIQKRCFEQNFSDFFYIYKEAYSISNEKSRTFLHQNTAVKWPKSGSKKSLTCQNISVVNICKRNKKSSFFVKRRGCLSNFAKTLTKLL